MADFYKFEIANWNEGTANMTLEQEAAYLRVVNAIRLNDQPITFNIFVLCGLWRCNERKAKRILNELVEAGKIVVRDGQIINEKAVEAASNLSRLRVERASAGRRGGIESGKSRSKALEYNDTDEASASTREEKRREDIDGGGGGRAREPAPAPARGDDPPPDLTNLPDDAVRLYEQVMTACNVQKFPLPRYWMPPMAIIEVARWRGYGLSDEEIIEVARGSRKSHRDPPDGPRALERSMTIAAGVKVGRKKPQQITGGSHDRNGDPDAGSEALRRSLARAAEPDKGLDFW